MKIKSLLILLVVLFSVNTISAQQPFSGCWHPDFIIDWTPEKDPDRKFNKSSVPLQQRMAPDPVLKSHNQQFPDGQVSACLTMHPMCSQVPAQGADNFIGYNPTYWQYMDLLIWWGGSAGEGIILPPSAPVIDAAHLSGVKALGQIFFPPTAFGGNPAWTTQMNSKAGDGTFPYARKCVDIAKYYGFDGWFINSETITSANWGEWTADYYKYCKEIGLEGQEIQLYVMSSGTSGAYITDTAKQKGASYFVNYGGVSTNGVNSTMNNHVSQGWGDRADAFRTWYYGLEQAQGGLSGNGGSFYTLFPTTGHIGSVDFFNPEEPIWKQVVKDLLNTSDAQGTKAYTAMNTVFSNEGRFWTNQYADVSAQRSGTSTMQGLATAIQERSAVTSLPFITTFSAGLGKHRFVNGELRGTQDWYHRGMQTVMPTWRWRQMKGSSTVRDIKFSYNWDDAYNMGTSINMSASLTNGTDYSVYLYETDLAISSGDKLQFVYKTNKPGSLKIKLADSSNGLNLAIQTASSTKTSNGWTIDEYDLSAFAGKTLRTIGLNINASDGAGFTAQLGQLAVYPSGYAPAAAQVTNLTIENELTEEGGDLRVVWDKVNSNDIHHYNVYLERNGETRLAGQTRNEGFYIPKFTRSSKDEKTVKVTVKAVNKNMEESTSGPSVAANFPAIKKPNVSMKASKTLIKVGDEVTFTAKADNYPETYAWSVPTGATLVSSNENVAVVKFNQEGLFDMTVSVTNEVGTTTYTEEDLINVSNTAAISIVSRASAGGKVVDVSSYMVGANEGPQWLIDDVTVPGSVNQKWCAGGDKEHWVILELPKVYELYRFQIYDCGHKEGANENLTHYRIYTSLDGDNWTLALDEKDVPATATYNTKDDYIKPTLGRFVKFVPYDPEKAITIRIWQFDVWGMSVPLAPIISNITSNKTIVKTGDEVTFEAVVSENPTSYEWIVEGGQKVSQTDNKAVFTFAAEGTYSVTVKATNTVGTNSFTKEDLVQVSNTISEERMPLIVKTGFSNHDAIAEGKPSVNYSSAPLDDQGWVFYTSGVQAAGALPIDESGLSVAASGNPYKLGPLDGNNVLLLNPVTSGSLTFEGSHRATELSFVATSMNGASTIAAQIVYTDGTRSEAKSFGVKDWCSTDTGTAFGSIGRIIRATKDGYTADTVEPEKCRMFEYVMEADPTKIIESVSFSKSGSGYPAVFAVSILARTGVALDNVHVPTVKVYPNPVKSGSPIFMEVENAQKVRVISLQGTVIAEQAINGRFAEISTSHIQPGTYILQAIGETTTVAKIIVK